MKYARHSGPRIDPRVAVMAEMYNADPRATFDTVAVHFGVSGSRVKQMLAGVVQQRRGKGQGREVLAPIPTVAPQLFPTERELVMRREATRAKLEQDPDVLRCREERAKRSMSLGKRPEIVEAKRELKEMLARTGKPGRPRKSA